MNTAFRVALGTIAVSVASACSDTQAPPVTHFNLIPDSAEQILFNIELTLTDGYTSGGGLGLGLNGARKLSHEFDIWS